MVVIVLFFSALYQLLRSPSLLALITHLQNFRCHSEVLSNNRSLMLIVCLLCANVTCQLPVCQWLQYLIRHLVVMFGSWL